MYNSDELRQFFAKAKSGSYSHAYIVDGSDGIGKYDFAIECARAIVCSEHNKPCGYCTNCKKVQSGNHPDIQVVGREKNASIDDVRRLISRAALKPNDSEKQVFIICNASKLRPEAQNALLKLFEEPPASVVIFLLAESRSSLLPTVLSRGQRVHLDGLCDNEIEEKLRDKYPSAKNVDIMSAISVACGNYGIAEKFLAKESASLRDKAENLLLLALQKKNYELTSALIIPKYKRDQLRAIVNELVILSNEFEKSRYGVPNARKPKNEELAFAVKNASKRSLARIGEVATACIIALDGNGNVTTVATKFAIDLLKAAMR